MEMMEINERLMEVESAEDLAAITGEALAIENALDNELNVLTHNYDQLADETAKEDRLNKIADIYYRKKYLLRIKESLDTFAARFSNE